jgi:uncharacterized protein YuzE
MQLTYDPRHNIAYLRLKEQGAGVETITISDALNLDIAPDGSLYGIEFLNANEQIGHLSEMRLTAVNEENGREAVLELP